MKVINIMGEIVADPSYKWTDTDVAPCDIQAALADDTADGVEIAINSPGGDVTGGLAICNMIKAAQAGGVKVTAHIYGLAASMASVIACACDEIIMDEASFMMIHNPWTKAVGDAEELRDTANTLDKMRDAIMSFYVSKFDKTAEEIKSLMDAETWIGGGEIASYGLNAVVVPSEIKAAACLSRRDFANAPEGARAFFRVCAEMPVEKAAETPAEAEATAEAVNDTPETVNAVETAETPVETAAEVSNEVARLTDALMKCEAKRRDMQSALDKARAEVAALKRKNEDLTVELAQAKADASAALAEVMQEKRELEARLTNAAIQAFATVATVEDEMPEKKTAETWRDRYRAVRGK